MRLFLASAFWLAVSLALLTAQQPAQQQPVFKRTALHVAIDVVATDAHDNPVTDLTAADFELRDEGRVQAIEDFERVIVPPGQRALADLKAIPGPAPDTFSNAPPPRTGRAFVFLIYSVGTDLIVPTKRMLTEFVRTLSPDDEVAVTYTGRSDLGQDFTRDPGLVMRAFDQLGLGLLAPKDDVAHLTFESVIKSLAAARETRRAIVLVSSAVPDPSVDPRIYRDLELAKQLGIPFYPIDPKGLLAPPLMLEGHLEDQRPELRMAAQQGAVAAQELLRTYAEFTGGRAFVNRNDLDEEAKELVADNSCFYVLGFYPTPYPADGKFHDVKVRVTRPGIKVRARAGYTAEKTDARSTKPPRLIDTVGDGLPGGDLLLRAFAAPMTPSPRGVKTMLTIEVAYPPIDAGKTRGDDHLELVWMAIDPDGRVRASGRREMTLPLAGVGRGSLTLDVNDVLDLPTGLLTVRVAAASRLLGTRGTVHIPVEIPKSSKNELALAPLVLGTSATSTDVRVVSLAPSTGIPFQPTVSRTFASQEKLRVYGRVFSPKSSDLAAVLRLEHNGAVVKTAPLHLTPVRSLKGALDAVAVVDLAGLAAGAYELHLSVQGSAGSSADRTVAIAIRPSTDPR